MCTFVVSDEMPIFVNMNYESYVDHKKKMWTKWYSNKRLQITVVIDFVLLARTQLHNYSHSRTKVLTWIHRYIYIFLIQNCIIFVMLSENESITITMWYDQYVQMQQLICLYIRLPKMSAMLTLFSRHQ